MTEVAIATWLACLILYEYETDIPYGESDSVSGQGSVLCLKKKKKSDLNKFPLWPGDAVCPGALPRLRIWLVRRPGLLPLSLAHNRCLMAVCLLNTFH